VIHLSPAFGLRYFISWNKEKEMGRGRIALRVMLWSLALSAALGVTAMLTGGHSVVWRMLGTAVAASVAAGLMLPLAMMVDRTRARPAGLLGMGIVLGGFMLVCLLIWNLLLFDHSFDEVVAFAFGWLFACGPAAILFLWLAYVDDWEAAGRTGAVATGVIYTLLVGGEAWQQWHRHDPNFDYESSSYDAARHLLETAAALAATLPAAVFCLVGARRGAVGVPRLLGVAGSALATVLWVWVIWMGSSDSLAGKLLFVLSLGGAHWMALANLSSRGRLGAGQAWVKWGTLAALGGCVACIALLVWADHVDRDATEMLGRLAGAAGIAAAFGALALLVLHRLNRGVDHEPSALGAARIELSLTCPRCSLTQSLPVGGAKCSGCDLRIEIRVEEPRCPVCNYLLFKLTQPRCPECGTAVGHASAAI